MGGVDMESHYTAIVERDRDWYVMHCVEIRASGYGPTLEAAKASLTEAILLSLELDAFDSEVQQPHQLNH
jgi:predicted RNase H-like HicB family nuclease